MRATRRADVEPIEQRVVGCCSRARRRGRLGAGPTQHDRRSDRTAAGRDRPPLSDVDAIANAWFARARLAMLALPTDELAGRIADERIALAFIAWLDSLAPHRRVAAEILRHKLYPSHPHHWVPLVFDLSRLVHDLLDVARVPGHGRLRQAQEIGLTAITLVTLASWLQDDSPAQEHSKRGLRRRLARAGRIARWMRSPAETGSSTTPEEPAQASEPRKVALRRRRPGAAPA